MSEKELNRIIEEFLFGLIKLIGKMFKSIYWGVRKLNKKRNIILLLFSFIVCFIGYFLKGKFQEIPAPIYIRYMAFYLVLGFPILYLMILGNTHDRLQEKYNTIFKDIGFVGPDGKYPYLISKHADGKKVSYIFKSLIPLQDWKKSINKLETGLDCNILIIQEGKNKKLAELITVPSDCRIPEMVNWSNEYIAPEESVFVVGEGALDRVKFDLNKTPHILIAGETGSGKSVILRVIIKQFIKKGCQVFMFDFKGGVEFGIQYEKYGEVVTDRNRAVSVLTELVKENERRLRLFRESGAKNLGQYNKKTGENLKRIGVFCDEVAEMLDKKGASKELKETLEVMEGLISTIARLSRATGINLIVGIQRPDANVLTGQIKNNIPVRISGRFADKPASEIVLGNTMAVDLPEIKGRFLFKIGNEIFPFQAYYFDDDTMLDEDESPLSSPSIKKDETKKSRINRKIKKVPVQKAENKSSYEAPSMVIEETDPNIFDEKITWSPEENIEKEDEMDLLNLDLDYSDFDFNYSEIDSEK